MTNIKQPMMKTNVWLPTAAVLACALNAGPAMGQSFEDIVGNWVAQDATNPMPSDAIVFAGSSSISRWEGLQEGFHDYNVIQRGLSGSTFGTYAPFIDDVVTPYNPRAVVIWLGTNDLAGGTSPSQVVAGYQQFAAQVHANNPSTDIFYLGIAPTPGRQSNRPGEDSVNAAIANLAAQNTHQHYIDLPQAYEPLNPYQDPAFTGNFVDSIHLNKAGYQFWVDTVRPQIEQVIAPNKVYNKPSNALQVGQSMLFDFGPSGGLDGDHVVGPDARGNHWNTWHPTAGGVGISSGEHIGDLVNTQGDVTSLDLTITGRFLSNGKRNGGLATSDPALLGDLAVDDATEDYFFLTNDDLPGGNDGDNGGFMLSGLDADLLYDIAFFGSRNTTETRITEYRLAGADEQVLLLQTSGNNIGNDGAYDGNDDELALFEAVQPDAFGQFFVDLTLVQGSFAYVNAMEITAVGIVPEPGMGFLALAAVPGLLMRRRRQL